MATVRIPALFQHVTTSLRHQHPRFQVCTRPDGVMVEAEFVSFSQNKLQKRLFVRDKLTCSAKVCFARQKLTRHGRGKGVWGGGKNKLIPKLWFEEFVSTARNKLRPGEFVSLTKNKLWGEGFVSPTKNKLRGKGVFVSPTKNKLRGKGVFVSPTKNKLKGKGLFPLRKTLREGTRGVRGFVSPTKNKLWGRGLFCPRKTNSEGRKEG